MNDMFLIVYRCYDNQEEEPCFVVTNHEDALSFLDTRPPPPVGFERRDGYYFFEATENPLLRRM